MINKISNIASSSTGRLFAEALLAAGIIYGLIHLRSSGYEISEVEKFNPVAEVTTERGLYINDFRIPLEAMKQGKEITLPYSAIKSSEGGLKFIVDDPNLQVDILTKKDNKWNLEARLEPAKKVKDGKDGLSFQGDLPSEYLVKIRANDQNYLLRLAR